MARKSALRMALDQPLTGVGAGHLPVKYGAEYRPPGVGRGEIPWSNAHSIYFLALGEFGFTGVFLLLGIIFSNLRQNERLWRDIEKEHHLSETARRLVICMQASFIGFAVGGAVLSGLIFPRMFVLAALNESVVLMVKGSLPKKTHAEESNG